VKLRNALLAATMMSLPAAAMAEPVNGLYISLSGGANFMENSSNNLGAIYYPSGFVYNVAGSYGVHYTGAGYAVTGAVGYGTGNGVRLELEGGYRSNGLVSSDQGPGAPLANIRGNETKYTIMGNILFDLTSRVTGIDLGVTPYVGIGAGAAIVGWDKADRYDANPNTVNNIFSGHDTRFAMQAMVGFSYDVAAVPGLAVTLDARVLDIPHFVVDSTLHSTNSGIGIGNFPSRNHITKDFQYSTMLGLRYAFGAPAASATPAAPGASAIAPAAVSRSYIVFFDWDKATLSDRARSIVADAAAASKKVAVTKIEVNGYTDTSGTPAYNKGLALSRAKAVMAELVKDGVPAASIGIHSFGDTNLLVPTGPGVREPQNRRVEIILK